MFQSLQFFPDLQDSLKKFEPQLLPSGCRLVASGSVLLCSSATVAALLHSGSNWMVLKPRSQQSVTSELRSKACQSRKNNWQGFAKRPSSPGLVPDKKINGKRRSQKVFLHRSEFCSVLAAMHYRVMCWQQKVNRLWTKVCTINSPLLNTYFTN